MPKLYACIISPDAARDKHALVTVAAEFAHAIEVIEDGILFDVSGLERLMGNPESVAEKILAEMRKRELAGNVAVAETVDTATLLARQKHAQNASSSLFEGHGKQAEACTLNASLNTPDMFSQLPLSGLGIEQDTLNVFSELGLRTIKDLAAVPQDELVGRYGQQFTEVIDVLEQRGRSLITPNIKENRASWSFDLNNPVEDFEQLMFLLNHGLERLFAEVKYAGFSTEHLDLKFLLRKSPGVSNGLTSNDATKSYEIKTSFPTLERSFWLKLINLRASLDPPEELITAVDVTAHFTRPRPDQRGLYAVSRPEPESLLLTVGKLKKLVGEENVGVPVLVDQRLERPFGIDKNALPDVGCDRPSSRLRRIAVRRSSTSLFSASTERQSLCAHQSAEPQRAIIGFDHFIPPLRAEVLARDGRLVYVKTRSFAGHVVNFSGVWKGNSTWWDQPWRTHEWDIEIENGGVYRLSKLRGEWFVTGEYD